MSGKQEEPENPFEGMPDITVLAQAAAAMKEMFDSLMEGGFTEKQALYIVATMVAQGGKGEDT